MSDIAQIQTASPRQVAQYLRVKEVAIACGIAMSTVWALARAGDFPQPFKLSPRVTVWDAAAVRAWQEARRGNPSPSRKGGVNGR